MKQKIIIWTMTFILLISFASAIITFNDLLIVRGIHTYHNGTWTGYAGTGTENANYFTDDAIVNDSVYFVDALWKFSGVKLNVGTGLNATSITCVWEYNNKALGGYEYNWTALSNVNDTSNCFQVAGAHNITWDVPADMGSTGYLYAGGIYSYSAGFNVRIRITSVTGITEGGANSGGASDDIEVFSYAVRINDGNTYNMKELCAYANSLGLNLTETNRMNTSCTLYSNLWISNGQMNIREGDHFILGKESGPTGLESYMMIIEANGILQMGQLSADGYGYDGATMVWNAYVRGMTYNYMQGIMKLYDSRLYIPYAGMGVFSISGTIDWRDSTFATDAISTTYITTAGNGNITRTHFSSYRLYVYGAGINIDEMVITRAGSGTASKGLLSGSNRQAKITNLDFQDYLEMAAIYKTEVELLNCKGVNTDYWNLMDVGNDANLITELYTSYIKVTDNNGLPIENATVTITDAYGRTALFENFQRIYPRSEVRLLDTLTDTVGAVFPGTSSGGDWNVGDVFKLRTEYVNITNVADTIVTFDRNLTGTLLPSKQYWSLPYKVVDGVLTSNDGMMYYNGSIPFEIGIREYIRAYDGGGVSQTEYREYNPFTISITHPDYVDKTFEINFTGKIGTEEMPFVINLEDDYPWEINGTIVLNYPETLIVNRCT